VKHKITNPTIWLCALVVVALTNVRWFSLFYNNRLVYAAPIILAVCLFIWSSLNLTNLSLRGRQLLVLTVLLLTSMPLFFAYEPVYSLESFLTVVNMVLLPLALFPAVLTVRNNWNSSVESACVNLILVLCLIQSVFLVVEVKLELGTMFRPNSEGTSLEWAYSDRFGLARSKYTFSSPMIAGTWSWLFGVILLLESFSSKFHFKSRLLFLFGSIVSFLGSLFTISRGPIMLEIVSIAMIIGLKSVKNSFVAGSILLVCVLLIGLVGGGLILSDDLFFALDSITRIAFSSSEEGNQGRLVLWQEGLKRLENMSLTGNGLHTASFMSGALEANFENTYLNMVYAAGVAGLLNAVGIIFVFLIQISTVLHALMIQRRFDDLVIFAMATTIPFFFYTFVFPCQREIEISSIFFLVLLIPLSIQELPKNS